MSPSVDLLSAALRYAERGWPVLPLHTPTSFGHKVGRGHAACSCRRAACTSQGKHPRTAHGVQDATTDPTDIARWWARWPDANVGLATGIAFDVLDLDGPDALDALDQAAPSSAGPISGPMQTTGRGIHILTLPSGLGNRAGLLPGVDWRGSGGYIVAAPSLHYLAGDRYGWGDEWGLDTGIYFPLAPAPPWLFDLLSKGSPPRGRVSMADGFTASPSYGHRALHDECTLVAAAREGTRNDTLNRAAFRMGQLIGAGLLHPREALVELLEASERCGLPEAEAIEAIRSGTLAGASNPRSASA